MAAYSAQTGSVTAAVLPSSINASVNQNFSIDIDISNVLDLYGWEFKLGWNASLLSEVSVSEGPFLNSSGNTFFTYYLNTTDEHVVVDCTLLGQVPGVNGNGTLATITFYTVDVGQTPLHLYEVTLVNSADELINCTSQDGYGTFNLQVDPDLGGCKMPYLM
jgi:general secretion pathway protein D